jgi:Region found in RelA / SpoT proteins
MWRRSATLSYIETLKNNCRSTGFNNPAKLKLLDEAHKLYKAGLQKHHEEHLASAALSPEYHFFKICQHAAMEFSKNSGPEMVAAALLAPLDRGSIKKLDGSLYSVMTAYDRMMSFHVPTKADERIIDNHYKMLIVDPILKNNYSGEELLSAHFLMAGIMLSTLEKGATSIQMFYRDPIILSQMALSTAELLGQLNKNYQANRLKDAALSVIRPDQYELFANMGYRDTKKLALLKKKDAMMIDIRRFCEDILKDQEGLTFKIEGRLKSVWSLMNKHKKYAKKNKRQALDVLGFRIIVHCPKGPSHIHSFEKEYQAAKLEDKNAIMKLYHDNIGQLMNLRGFFRMYAEENNWSLLEADDYLYNPNKNKNGYQSLQDTYNLPLEDGKDSSFEIQFVTDQMYDCNSTGSASSWSYKNPDKASTKYFKPDELVAMYQDLQEKLGDNVYAYAYKMNGFNNGNAMEISGPFEMTPDPGAYPMPLDVLSHINYFNARHFKRYDAGTRAETHISINEKISNGDMVRGEGLTAFGSKRFEFIGTTTGKNIASFHVESEAMPESEIAHTKKMGREFLDDLIKNRKNGGEKKLDVIFLQKLFLDELNCENMDMAHFYLGKSEHLRDRLKNDIGKYMLGSKYEPENSKITINGHRDSLLTRQIMEFIGKGKYNIRSIHKFLEGDRSIFEAELDNFSMEELKDLTDKLKENGSIRKTYDNVPANNIRDKKLEITFTKDQPGIIYSIYDFLIKNNCYVSSFRSDEDVVKANERTWKLKLSADDIRDFDEATLRAKQKNDIVKLSAEFDIKFAGKFNDEKYRQFLNGLKACPGTFIKTASLEVAKGVQIKV